MEAVATDDLIHFDLPATLDAERQPADREDVFSPEPASSKGLHQLQEPLAPSKSASHYQHHQNRDQDQNHGEDGDNRDDSDATGSADSENDMEPSSWELRRSSSSSAHSVEDEDTDGAERRRFMKTYVEKVFHGKEDLDQEEKARFGELCGGQNGKGREWFAKYVSAQRCHSKCVSEATFYRLVQSFAVVLFECYQMDDFTPAKNLMTMCFTYYHIGRCQPSPSELLERGAPPPPPGVDSYLNKANCWLSGRREAAERLLRSEVKGFFGGLESKLRSSGTHRTPDDDNPAETRSPGWVKKGQKVYLYIHLKQQPIWHSLRFWNAAFFDAVHCERTKRSPTTREKWCHMTQEERDDSSKIDENIAFGQLGTFTHNMLAFGLSQKLCNDFLKKQAVIGNLNQEQYKLLIEHIEKMASE